MKKKIIMISCILLLILISVLYYLTNVSNNKETEIVDINIWTQITDTPTLIEKSWETTNSFWTGFDFNN